MNQLAQTTALQQAAKHKTWNLPGGVHPPENKAQSLRGPIRQATIARELIYPLNQHIGAPAMPCVEVGQQVLKYECIARARGAVSAPIHASTSGVITAIEPRPLAHPSGLEGPCIVLQADAQDKAAALNPCADYTQLKPTQLLERIRAAGIAGMGGAGFPSAVKLASDKQINTLIINATECEPYITADDSLIRERAAHIISGIQIVQHLVQPTQRTLIGIEDNKPEAIVALQNACANTDIEVVSFATKYPSGGEKQLIYILTGQEVPSGGLPADIGVLCQNIGTCAALRDAIIDGKPLISRITTITGDCVKPQNYEVRLGTPVAHLLQLSQFKPEKRQRLVMGGPMMGFTLSSSAVPVIKTTNCVIAPTLAELPPEPIAQACIRCGLCAQACPAGLLPQQLYWFARSKNHEQLHAHHLFDCIECGACSFSCPSHIPLVQYYRSSKADIRADQAEKIQAEKAKVRFEQRQERLEKEQREKEEKRKARKEAALKAKQSDDKQDVIAAAIARTKAKKAQSSAPPKQATASDKELDPAQAAIERARQKRNEPQTEIGEEQQLEQHISTLEKRIANAENKMQALEGTNEQKIASLEKGLQAQRAKLNTAREQLAALKPAAATTQQQRSTEPDNAAQAAIERAKQARAQQAELNPEQQRKQALAKITQRIAVQEKKYIEFKASDPDKAELIKQSLDQLKTKQATLQSTAHE